MPPRGNSGHASASAKLGINDFPAGKARLEVGRPQQLRQRVGDIRSERLLDGFLRPEVHPERRTGGKLLVNFQMLRRPKIVDSSSQGCIYAVTGE